MCCEAAPEKTVPDRDLGGMYQIVSTRPSPKKNCLEIWFDCNNSLPNATCFLEAFILKHMLHDLQAAD